MDRKTYEALGLHKTYLETAGYAEVNGRSNLEIAGAVARSAGDESYHPCPEAYATSAVPRGSVEKLAAWSGSRAYPETSRELWIYTPPAFKPGTEHGFALFNDGEWYLSARGPVRAPAVLDTLLHAGEIGPMIAVFVSAGRPAGTRPVAAGEAPSREAQQQRSLEYDSIDDTFARFVTEELMPLVARRTGPSCPAILPVTLPADSPAAASVPLRSAGTGPMCLAACCLTVAPLPTCAGAIFILIWCDARLANRFACF